MARVWLATARSRDLANPTQSRFRASPDSCELSGIGLHTSAPVLLDGALWEQLVHFQVLNLAVVTESGFGQSGA